MKFVLNHKEVGLNPDSEELAAAILARVGLEPRKKGSTEQMHKTLLELYERTKRANREKKPEDAVMTVEEMGLFAGISRQTMYDYLGRWTKLELITKTSYIKDGKVIIGYKLNGATLESAFDKTRLRINNHLEITKKYIQELQRVLKNEKISKSVAKKPQEHLEPSSSEEAEEIENKNSDENF